MRIKNVLSLFDGMSCGQIALNRAGIEYESYYASEIDDYAIAVTQNNYPNTVMLGDVTKWREWDLDWSSISLLIGGSPCQGLSQSGRGKGLDDPRSALFWDYMDILEHIRKFNPNVLFLLENVVPQKKEWADNMTDAIGVEPIMIDSALLSAQSRKRLYWTNIPNIDQPKDKGIYLKDILESVHPDSSKSYCVDANYFRGGNLKQYFKRGRRQLVFEGPVQIAYISKNQQGRRVYSTEGKAITLKANGGGWGAKTGLYLINNIAGITRKDRYELISEMVESGDLIIRKLTPVECERLQTVPDNYTQLGLFDKVKKISDTQRYRMLGNGFTIDVVAHILSFMI